VLASGKVNVAVGVDDIEELSITATLSIQTYLELLPYRHSQIIQIVPHFAAEQGWGVSWV
jgi:hypothetical protein